MTEASDSAEAIFASECEDIFRTKEPETFWEWMPKNYFLSAESSNTKGMFLVPHGYQRSFAFVLWDLDSPEVNLVKGTQQGASHVCNAFALYEVVERARSTAVFLPRNADTLYYSSLVLASAIKDSEVCTANLKVDPTKKDAENTNRRKGFIKGQIFCRSSDSPSEYDQFSAETVMQDEASRMPFRVTKTKDEQGESPFDMIKSRMDAADFRKHVAYSSPEEYGACAVTELYESSEVRVEQHIPCPHCDHYQPLVFSTENNTHGMHWDRVTDSQGKRNNRATSLTARYKCRGCKDFFEYEDMIKMDDRHGTYMSENVIDEETGEVIKDGIKLSVEDRCWYYMHDGSVAPKPYSIGIRQNSLFSRTKSWSDGTKQYLDAVDALKRGDNSKMMAFEKKYLAQAWHHVDATETIQWEFIRERVEKYCQSHDDLRTYGVPLNVQAVVGWWDLQNDWIQGFYIGYGYGQEKWWLRNMIRMGDPATTNSLDIVEQMQSHIFQREDGVEILPTLQGIDSGDRPDLAYNKSLELGRTRVIPTKGSSVYGHPMIVFPEHPKQNCKNTFMTMVGPSTTKDLIYGRIGKVLEPGPGYTHFPKNDEFNDEFFRGLASEKKMLKSGKIDYVKQRERNEPLDGAVGCQALITIAQLPKFGLKLIQSSEIQRPSSPEVIQPDIKTAASIASSWRRK